MATDTDKLSQPLLQQRQQIELYTEELVQLADAALSERRMQALRTNMKTSQLSNLLGVALEAQSPAAVHNWILYQMGRRETSRAWEQSGFGEAVLRDLRQIETYAGEVVNAVYGAAEEDRRRRVQAVNIEMLRLYTGYLKRWFVARGGQS